MNSLLPMLLEEFHEKIKHFPEGVIREKTFPPVPHKIMVVIGMRRTGKTHLLFQRLKHLLKEIPLTRLLYLNFEDDRLSPMDHKQLAGLIDGFYSLYPENHDHTCYLFLDEIQNVENWHQVIRRYFDTKKIKIYLTGSSAKLLSKEIATSLRGRAFPLEVWPFSYREYLKARNIAFPPPLWGQKSVDQFKKGLELYLVQGGFPEIAFWDEHIPKEERGGKEYAKTLILQGYVFDVIFRDIVERYKVTNTIVLKYMIKMMLKNVGLSFSIHKLFEDLKSQGFQVAKGTLYEYLAYISDSYLAFTVPLYAESIRKVQTNPRKIYAVDTGLSKAYATSATPNLGHHFENLVYLDLRRRGDEIYYYLTDKDRREVDFLSCDLTGKWHLYQVCWNMDDAETWKRETVALADAEQELKTKGVKAESLIITPETYFSTFLPTL